MGILSSGKTGLGYTVAGPPCGLGNKGVRCFVCSYALALLILVCQVGLSSPGPGWLQLPWCRAVLVWSAHWLSWFSSSSQPTKLSHFISISTASTQNNLEWSIVSCIYHLQSIWIPWKADTYFPLSSSFSLLCFCICFSGFCTWLYCFIVCCSFYSLLSVLVLHFVWSFSFSCISASFSLWFPTEYTWTSVRTSHPIDQYENHKEHQV